VGGLRFRVRAEGLVPPARRLGLILIFYFISFLFPFLPLPPALIYAFLVCTRTDNGTLQPMPAALARVRVPRREQARDAQEEGDGGG
jgi:hypothetical protein